VIARSIDDVLDLYERLARERYDEHVTQLDHALQTAALAIADDARPAMVAAALLHDVGHLLTLDDGPIDPAKVDDHHEARGARYLAGLFAPAVTAPIALHVRAKRYLCSVDAAYHDGLSDGSIRSLELQGGPLNPSETRAFEQLPFAEDAVALRRWDDHAKVDGLEVAPIRSHCDTLEQARASS
jgi:gamma-butyrobetaine dioxygenase